MKFRIFGICALGLLASLATEAKANFVVNGGFEVPAIGNQFTTFPLGSTGITGWTVISGVNNPGNGSVDLLGSFFPPHSGLQSVDLDGSGSNPAGGVSQTITGLTVGSTYTLDFFYANNPLGAAAGAQVTIAGLSANIIHAASTFALPNYLEFTSTFVATGTSQLLSFASTDPAGDFNGIVLDDVSINLTTVPEPASVTMLGLGLVGLGCYARARRRTA